MGMQSPNPFFRFAAKKEYMAYKKKVCENSQAFFSYEEM